MLTEEQQALDEIVQAMSADEVRNVVEYARTIVQQRSAATPLYDPDDDLTDEDLQAIAEDGFRRFAEEHPDDDWGYDNMDLSQLQGHRPKGDADAEPNR